MITVIDYGLGNIQAFLAAYKRLNIEACAASERRALLGATKLILPGVGAFDTAMERLGQSGLRESLEDLVLRRKLPVLGVCVGMQVLAAGSDEGALPGLGWIDGHVRQLQPAGPASALPLPHMGWNEVSPLAPHPLFEGLGQHERFYFLHSYHLECAQPGQVLATTDHGGRFTSAVHAGNVFGVQFHPEKSHQAGMRLLRNFAAL